MDTSGTISDTALSYLLRVQRALRPRHRLFQVVLVELDADEAHSQRRACNRGTAQSQEWIGGDPDPRHAVQLEAIRRQPPRERGRMRALLVAALNGVVGQKPGVAAAPQA